MSLLTVAEVARMIDHSLLQPKLTDEELFLGCQQAKDWSVASVCIKPYAVRLASSVLLRSGVAVGTTVGFPHGSATTASKMFEAEQALRDGATELDMVVNIGKVLSCQWSYVTSDIRGVVDVAHAAGSLVKVIFENSMLDDSMKIKLCEICSEVGADFVKTSTGYGDGGATDEDLRLMRQHSLPHVGIKAAGGVRTFERLLQVRHLGVTRVGATATGAILEEARRAATSSSV
jgi:deoxyribose-phosphate aldolase